MNVPVVFLGNKADMLEEGATKWQDVWMHSMSAQFGFHSW
jgi:hypothetical protein